MAEIDEDTVPNGELDNTEIDLSDETQDFRLLTTLSQTSQAPQTLPRRGEKDFEHHGTKAQLSTLEASRLAMHHALSHTRTHQPKTAIVALYNPDHDTTIIEHATGQHFKTIGKHDSLNRVHLLPEETLYLVERGTLDLRWNGIEELEGLPLSLQAAYTYMIGSQGLTLERYTVYSGLKRSGYSVLRAPTWYAEDYDKVEPPPRTERQNPSPPSALGIFARLYASVFSNTDSLPDTQKPLPSGPLVQPGLYRSYTTIYQRLALINYHNPSIPTDRERDSDSSLPELSDVPYHRLRPTFNVWKPNNALKKTALPAPDFQIVVVDAREEAFPSLEQLDDLLQCMPYNPPRPVSSYDGGNQLYNRLRHGYRHVIFAVVDQGIVSYVRVGDAGFGLEKIYERVAAQGKKSGRGGWQGKRGGGNGRERGRG